MWVFIADLPSCLLTLTGYQPAAATRVTGRRSLVAIWSRSGNGPHLGPSVASTRPSKATPMAVTLRAQQSGSRAMLRHDHPVHVHLDERLPRDGGRRCPRACAARMRLVGQVSAPYHRTRSDRASHARWPAKRFAGGTRLAAHGRWRKCVTHPQQYGRVRQVCPNDGSDHQLRVRPRARRRDPGSQARRFSVWRLRGDADARARRGEDSLSARRRLKRRLASVHAGSQRQPPYGARSDPLRRRILSL